MRYSAEHKQKTRDRVLRETALVIREQGAQNVGVADVMARSGLTHGGFYAHFASKDALVAAAVEQMFAGSVAHIASITTDLGPREALSAYVDFYLSERHRDRRDMGCPLPVLATDLPHLASQVQAQYEAGVGRITRTFATFIEALGFADSAQTASSLLAELVGGLLIARALGNGEASGRVLRASKAQIKSRLGLL